MASFGDTLKRERELREISLREISDATKINIRYLEALEQNRFDALPGGLFNKGFIRAYSTYIGVDGEAMVNCYLDEIACREDKARGGADSSSEMLRPAEAPRRRASSADSVAGSNGRTLAITFAPPGVRGAPPATPASAPAPRQGTGGPVAAAPSGPEARAAAQAGDARSGAITRIDSAPASAEPSRVLPGILTGVGVAAGLFLILGLILGRSEPRRTASNPAASPAVAPLPEHGTSEPETGGTPDYVVAGAVGSPPAAPRPAAAERRAGQARSGADEMSAGARETGLAPSQHAGTPPAAPRPAATPPAAPAETSEANAASSIGPMDLQIETTGTTWVQLFCDNREAINWVMKGGESQVMRCLRQIRVNAADAAAVLLRVNGSPCSSLGDPGSRVHGYTIRIDDFRQICPQPGGGNDGRL